MNRQKRGRARVGAIGFLLVLFAFAAPTRAADTAQVAIRDFAFEPATVTVKAGTTVTWTNQDDDPHLVISNGKAFRSDALDTGQSYSFTFDSVGDYEYFCQLHPHMTGKIVVVPGS